MNKNFLTGAVSGLLNGLFGSGGGTVVVPMLESSGVEPRKSHATSVAIVFFLSLISTVMYGMRGDLDFSAAFKYVPWGILGAFFGALMLKKINSVWLRRLFGAIILVSAIRMFV
jgi:uncharacterized membrane protein YfcA